MLAIHSCDLPSDALLNRYAASGGYVDCYVTELAASVSHQEYVEAFYTTAVFKLERLILRLLAARPSTDAEAAELARGESASFAAWSVEERSPGQLLLADFTGRTKSWLRIAPRPDGGTQLYFGSAVVPLRDRKTGRVTLGPAFNVLLGFHKLYSQTLLFAARRRLARKAQSHMHVSRNS